MAYTTNIYDLMRAEQTKSMQNLANQSRIEVPKITTSYGSDPRGDYSDAYVRAQHEFSYLPESYRDEQRKAAQIKAMYGGYGGNYGSMMAQNLANSEDFARIRSEALNNALMQNYLARNQAIERVGEGYQNRNLAAQLYSNQNTLTGQQLYNQSLAAVLGAPEKTMTGYFEPNKETEKYTAPDYVSILQNALKTSLGQTQQPLPQYAQNLYNPYQYKYQRPSVTDWVNPYTSQTTPEIPTYYDYGGNTYETNPVDTGNWYDYYDL